MVDRLFHSGHVTEQDLIDLRREAIEYFGPERTGIVDWAVAWDVMGLVFGQEWMHRNVPEETRDPYLRSDTDEGLEAFVRQSRVLELSKHLYELQGCANFESMVGDLRSRSLASAAAELFVAHRFKASDRTVSFVERSGVRGSDFDLTVGYLGREIAVEVKAKDEGTACTARTIQTSLDTARRQLPRDGPSVIVLTVPVSWSTDDQTGPTVLAEIERLLSGTGRVNAVVLLWDEWVPQLSEGYVLIRRHRLFANHAPRVRIPLVETLLTGLAPS